MAGASHATGGPSPSNLKRKATAPCFAEAVDDKVEAEEEDEEDIEEMERELADLDRRVLEYRRRHARCWLDNVASHLAALRPPAGPDISTVLKPSVAGNNEELLEKVKVIKSKHEANVAALDKLLERINESIAQSEILESLDVKINPLFQRK